MPCQHRISWKYKVYFTLPSTKNISAFQILSYHFRTFSNKYTYDYKHCNSIAVNALLSLFLSLIFLIHFIILDLYLPALKFRKHLEWRREATVCTQISFIQSVEIRKSGKFWNLLKTITLRPRLLFCLLLFSLSFCILFRVCFICKVDWIFS